MNKIFIGLFLIFSNCVKAQDFNETVSYINTLLKANTYNPTLPGSTSEYDEVYDQISIDVHGKLECNRFLVYSNPRKTSKVFQFYAYLKSLKPGHKTDYTDYYVTTLDCLDSKLCFGGLKVERSDVYFSISTASNRDKLYNAFSHLLDLAKDNKVFYEKDPFGN